MGEEFDYLIPIFREIKLTRNQELSRQIYHFVSKLIPTQHLNPEILAPFLEIYLEKNRQLQSIFPLLNYQTDIDSCLNNIKMYNKRQAKGKASYKKELLYHCTIYKYLVIACNAEFTMELIETYSTTNREDEQLKLVVLEILHSHFSNKFIDNFYGTAESANTQSKDYSGLLGALCDFVLNLCPEIEGQNQYMVDAPLLLDFEVKYRLSEALTELKEQVDVDPVRIDYIITSIQHLVTFGGNMKVWADTNGKWRQEQKAQSKPTRDKFEDSEMACIVGLKDTELIIMKLLEDDLPDYLKKMDRSLKRSSKVYAEAKPVPIEPHQIFEPKPDILSNRRNIFDGDQFDVFSHTVDPSKVQVGKKENADTEQERVDFLHSQREKILATQYDDDEYDDTYDSADFVPVSNEDLPKDNDYSKPDPIEKKLVEMYNINEAIFHQSQRKSLARQALVKQTGWSNEQIEGWYIMLNRNPKKDLVLQKYEFKGNKHVEEHPEPIAIESEESRNSSPTNKPAHHESSNASNSPKRGRGGFRGRGRGRDARLKKLAKGMN
ncbi:hypothetical protein HDV01_000091 [Terramyces sp. JEL0728]|nr:hypothetical protein HDV01_000091 [Terramyces sp. JEL0728]